MICLQVGLHWWEASPTMQVGSLAKGLIVAPMRKECRIALEERIAKLGWPLCDWLLDVSNLGRTVNSRAQGTKASVK